MEDVIPRDLAEIRLSFKNKVRASDRPKVANSRDAYGLLMKKWNLEKIELVEEFKILLLNRTSQCLGEYKLSSGGTTSTIADPKLIFAAAIKCNACGVILAHNHPSGSLTPSEPDITLTKKIIEGGNLLDILVLDHLIVTKEGFYSFADEGLI